MAQTLVVLRHADTEPDAVDDWHRELTDDGRAQARSLGPVLAALGLGEPLTVCVSTALRAAQTWAEIAPALPPADVRELPELYNAEPGRILDVLNELETDAGTVLVIAHNPGISELAMLLAGEPLPGDPRVCEGGTLRTCRAVVLDMAGSWADLAPGAATTREHLVPPSDS